MYKNKVIEVGQYLKKSTLKSSDELLTIITYLKGKLRQWIENFSF